MPEITVIATIVGTSASLRSTAGVNDKDVAEVLGYYSNGDGGGGVFYWDSVSEVADDNGTVIQPIGTVGMGRWKRRFSGVANVKWFGAKGDGVTDDTVAVQKAIDFILGITNLVERQYRSLEFPQGTFRITGTLMLDDTTATPPPVGGISIFTKGGQLYNRACLKLDSTTNGVFFRSTMQGITFNNIRFIGNSICTCLELKRSNESHNEQDYLNDVDTNILNCAFQSCKTGIETFGRQIVIQNCRFSQINEPIIINELNTIGKNGGPVRAIKIKDCQFHAIPKNSCGCINVKTHLAFGLLITNNFSDCNATFFSGYLIDSLLANNECYFIIKHAVNAQKLINSTISGNNFIQERKYNPDLKTDKPQEQQTFDQDTSLAIEVAEECQSSKIIGNSFGNAAFSAIKLNRGGNNNIISNNLVHRWGIASASSYAFELDTETDAFSNSVVHGNLFFMNTGDNVRHGIKTVNPASLNNMFYGNSINSNGAILYQLSDNNNPEVYQKSNLTSRIITTSSAATEKQLKATDNYIHISNPTGGLDFLIDSSGIHNGRVVLFTMTNTLGQLITIKTTDNAIIHTTKISTDFLSIIYLSNGWRLISRGGNKIAVAADTASAAPANYSPSQINDIISELRDLKSKMRLSGLLSE